LDISGELMKTTTLVCLLVLLAGCGKSAQDIERENEAAGMKVIAQRQRDLKEADKKYASGEFLSRGGASSQEQTKK
jgi:hypothetical protein